MGIRHLTDGLGELAQGGATLRAGSVVFRDNVQAFAAKMGEFKEKGMDEIDKKAGSLPEVKIIPNTMPDLAKRRMLPLPVSAKAFSQNTKLWRKLSCRKPGFPGYQNRIVLFCRIRLRCFSAQPFLCLG